MHIHNSFAVNLPATNAFERAQASIHVGGMRACGRFAERHLLPLRSCAAQKEPSYGIAVFVAVVAGLFGTLATRLCVRVSCA